MFFSLHYSEYADVHDANGYEEKEEEDRNRWE